MSEISIVCVYNNKDKLEKNLLYSLAKQKNCYYQLILVDNSDNLYSSASQALNYGCSQANTKFLVIVHQDIYFRNEYELSNLYYRCMDLNPFGVIGVAGRGENYNSNTLSSITDRIPEQECSKYKVDKPMSCQTVDECLFVINKEDFDCHHFDEMNTTWHLYAVEYAINMIFLGKENYIINSSLYHVSNATSLDHTYFKELIRFAKCINSENSITKIYTTCGIWNFRDSFGKMEILKNYIKQLIKMYMSKFK